MPGSMSSSMPETLVFSEMLFGFNPLDHAASDKMDLSVCVHFSIFGPATLLVTASPSVWDAAIGFRLASSSVVSSCQPATYLCSIHTHDISDSVTPACSKTHRTARFPPSNFGGSNHDLSMSPIAMLNIWVRKWLRISES